MSIWIWLALTFLALIAFRIFFPVLVALYTNARTLSRANSPEFRLSMPNLWTEIQHVKNGGSIQMMKMEDGNIIVLSVGLDTAKVCVAPGLDSIESFTEAANFPIHRAGKDFRSESEAILNKLRDTIAWPRTVDELRRTLSGLAETRISFQN